MKKMKAKGIEIFVKLFSTTFCTLQEEKKEKDEEIKKEKGQEE